MTPPPSSSFALQDALDSTTAGEQDILPSLELESKSKESMSRRRRLSAHIGRRLSSLGPRNTRKISLVAVDANFENDDAKDSNPVSRTGTLSQLPISKPNLDSRGSPTMTARRASIQNSWIQEKAEELPAPDLAITVSKRTIIQQRPSVSVLSRALSSRKSATSGSIATLENEYESSSSLILNESDSPGQPKSDSNANHSLNPQSNGTTETDFAFPKRFMSVVARRSFSSQANSKPSETTLTAKLVGESNTRRPSTTTKTIPATSQPYSRRTRQQEEGTFNITQALENIEVLDKQRDRAAAEWRIKNSNKAAAKEGSVFTVSHRGKVRPASPINQEFTSFTDLASLTVGVKSVSEKKRNNPAWKNKWENAMLVKETSFRFNDTAKLKQINDNFDDGVEKYGYKHSSKDPSAALPKGKQADSWLFNGQVLIKETSRKTSLVVPQKLATTGGGGDRRGQEKRASSAMFFSEFRSSDEDLNEEMQRRWRSGTVPTNFQLISNILGDDTSRRIEKELIGLGQKKLGKCPFLSDPDISNKGDTSLWGVLRQFRFPTEHEKKLLSHVHSLHPASISKYNDLRRVLHWSPANHSSSNHAKVPVTIVKATHRDAAPPPIIGAVDIIKQKEETEQDFARELLLEGISSVAVKGELPFPVERALHPKLFPRIAVSPTRKKKTLMDTGPLLLDEEFGGRPRQRPRTCGVQGAAEFQLLQSIQATHRAMTAKRRISSAAADEVSVRLAEKQMARWFSTGNHLSFHAGQFGFANRKVVLSAVGQQESCAGR